MQPRSCTQQRLITNNETSVCCGQVSQQTVTGGDHETYLHDLNNMPDLGSHQIWGP